MLVRKFIFQIILVINFARIRAKEKDQTLNFQTLYWGTGGLRWGGGNLGTKQKGWKDELMRKGTFTASSCHFMLRRASFHKLKLYLLCSSSPWRRGQAERGGSEAELCIDCRALLSQTLETFKHSESHEEMIALFVPWSIKMVLFLDMTVCVCFFFL